MLKTFCRILAVPNRPVFESSPIFVVTSLSSKQYIFLSLLQGHINHYMYYLYWLDLPYPQMFSSGPDNYQSSLVLSHASSGL